MSRLNGVNRGGIIERSYNIIPLSSENILEEHNLRQIMMDKQNLCHVSLSIACIEVNRLKKRFYGRRDMNDFFEWNPGNSIF